MFEQAATYMLVTGWEPLPKGFAHGDVAFHQEDRV
jgi:hypothetical protein